MEERMETGEVDPLGPDVRWAHLEPMVLFMAVVGAIFTLAVWQDWGWAYALGLVLTGVWVGGFVVTRDRRERWFRW
jgi:hypothetical protein